MGEAGPPGAGSTGANALELITKLVGAGIAFKGGGLGPVLLGIGDAMESRRNAARDRAANAALMELLQAPERSIDLPGTPTFRPGALSLTENPEAASITPGEGGAPGYVGRAPETRRYTDPRGPSRAEMLARLAAMPLQEPVRGAVMDRALRLRLPDEPRVPTDLDRERRVRAIEGGYATAFPGVDARRYAEATEAGARLPQPLTAEEQEQRGRETRTREARETLQREIGAGGYDLNTAAGVQGLQRRAAELGVPEEADRYVRQTTQRREIANAEREEKVRTTLVPQWRKRVDTLGGQKAMSPHVLEGVRAAIDAAEADPSAANVRGVTSAFQAAGKASVTQQQFAQRLAGIDARAKAAREQRDQTLQARVLGQLANEIEREIAIRQRDAYNAPDPVTRAQAALQVEELSRRLQQIEGLQFQRATTPTTPGAPAAVPPTAAPPAAPPSTATDDLRKKGYVK